MKDFFSLEGKQSLTKFSYLLFHALIHMNTYKLYHCFLIFIVPFLCSNIILVIV